MLHTYLYTAAAGFHQNYIKLYLNRCGIHEQYLHKVTLDLLLQVLVVSVMDLFFFCFFFFCKQILSIFVVVICFCIIFPGHIRVGNVHEYGFIVSYLKYK